MIIKDLEAINRLNSPMNLMNRLSSLRSQKKENGMNLFMPGANAGANAPKKNIPNENKIQAEPQAVSSFTPPENLTNLTSLTKQHPVIEQLIPNSTEQVKLNLAHDVALDVVNSAMSILSSKLDDIRADRLPGVITAANKVVETIRRDRVDASKLKNQDVHYHFYTPQQKSLEQYEIIDIQ